MSTPVDHSSYDVPPFLMFESVNRRWVLLGLAVLQLLALMYGVYLYHNRGYAPSPWTDLGIRVPDNRVLYLIMVGGFVILGWMIRQPRALKYSTVRLLVISQMILTWSIGHIAPPTMLGLYILYRVTIYAMNWDENYFDKLFAPYIYPG